MFGIWTSIIWRLQAQLKASSTVKGNIRPRNSKRRKVIKSYETIVYGIISTWMVPAQRVKPTAMSRCVWITRGGRGLIFVCCPWYATFT
ncbi:hypothetical protein RvY_08138-3 [Ramazzottius varieornatus]|uniref:Uncharacterized protein n=1 Tax=Ramazzottius varieornatus TaxID=947166 RepID=A0A1D1V4Q0_RAMVA|nr:hypothetical protein RvY_08138-3 [Ramazzottius varieornatus]